MRPLLIHFLLRTFPIRPRSRRPSTRSSRFALESLEGRELCTVATAATPPTVVSLQRFGVHGAPVQLVVTFSQPMDPLRASNPANYLLSSTSLDHRYFTALNLTTDLITSATYDPANQTVTLTPVKRLPLNRGQELIVNGQPGGLANQQGVLLDGEQHRQAWRQLHRHLRRPEEPEADPHQRGLARAPAPNPDGGTGQDDGFYDLSQLPLRSPGRCPLPASIDETAVRRRLDVAGFVLGVRDRRRSAGARPRPRRGRAGLPRSRTWRPRSPGCSPESRQKSRGAGTAHHLSICRWWAVPAPRDLLQEPIDRPSDQFKDRSPCRHNNELGGLKRPVQGDTQCSAVVFPRVLAVVRRLAAAFHRRRQDFDLLDQTSCMIQCLPGLSPAEVYRRLAESPHPLGIGIYNVSLERKYFQGKALSFESAQMNRVSHESIVIFSVLYNAVFPGVSSVVRIIMC